MGGWKKKGVEVCCVLGWGSVAHGNNNLHLSDFKYSTLVAELTLFGVSVFNSVKPELYLNIM